MADVFPKLRTRKTRFNKSLESTVSEGPSTSNIVWETEHL